jgi:hypothetical protein
MSNNTSPNPSADKHLAALPPKAQQMIERLQQQLMLVQQKNMLKLGDGAAFYITEGGQERRAFKAKVELSYPDQFCFIQKKAMICAPGLEKANQYAGIEIFKPQKLIGSGGKEEMNPYFTTDENGLITGIIMRGIGIGYSPLGNLAAVDQTIMINMSTVLLQELQAKLKFSPAIAALGHRDKRPAQFKANFTAYDEQARRRVVKKTEVVSTDDTWLYIPVFGLTGYWLDVSAPDVLEIFDGYIQKQRFIERTANTILRRQILSQHPAIGTKIPTVTCSDKGKEAAYVTVYGYKPEAGDAKKKRHDMEALAAKLAEGEKIANMDIVAREEDVSEDVTDVHASDSVDPSEIPIAPIRHGFEEDEESETYDGPVAGEGEEDYADDIPPAIETSDDSTSATEDVPATEKTPAELLKEIFADATMKPAAQKACAEMKTTYSEIRKAPAEIIGEFVSLVKKFNA